MHLEHLFKSNVAWAHRKTEQDPTFFSRLAEQQTPKLFWVGCSDSRVPANDVLGLDPGEVFVHRNIANVVHTSDMNFLTVLEYAVGVLKVEHVIVCGHYGCGGVERACGDERTALVDHWLQPLVMHFRKHKAIFDALPDRRSRIDRMCELNVAMQVRRIAATPIAEATWAKSQPLSIHGWIYGIKDGLLRDLDTSVSSFADRDRLPNIDELTLRPVNHDRR